MQLYYTRVLYNQNPNSTHLPNGPLTRPPQDGAAGSVAAAGQVQQ